MEFYILVPSLVKMIFLSGILLNMIGGFIYTYVKFKEQKRKNVDQNFNENFIRKEEGLISSYDAKSYKDGMSVGQHIINEMKSS